MLTEVDGIIIQKAVQDGAFLGSLYGTIVFHILFFGTILVIYLYVNRKYDVGTIIQNLMKKFS